MLDAKECLARYKELDSQYQTFIKPFFKDVSNYILPRRGMFMEDGSPDNFNPKRRLQNIIDDTATRANRTLGAGMQGGLCSPSRPWFRRGLADEDLAKWGPVKEWLHELELLEYKIYAGSNFYTVVHTCFEEQGGFGTSPIIMEADPERVFRFTICTAGEYRIALSANGRVDTLYWMRWWTAKQIVEAFGIGKVSQRVEAAFTSSPAKYFKVIQAIKPRENRNPLFIDNINMPFESIWFEYDEPTKILRESGYHEFPGAVPRWGVTGGMAYGMSPGLDALGNTKMLQEMQKASIKGLHKMVDPPMLVAGKFKGILDLTPGATNHTESGEKDRVGRLYEINLPLKDLEYKIESTRSSVERTYYTDLFLMLSATQGRADRTATEVLELHEEKLLMLGPTVERQIHELLEPILDRGFAIIERMGLLPPPPKELQGVKLKVDFISLLAQAQKLVTSQALHSYLGMVERVAMVDEGSLLKTDFNKFLESFGDTVGLPPEIMRSDAEVEELQEGQMAAQEEAAEADKAAQEASVMKDLGSANTGEGTALGDLKRAAR